VKAVWGLLGVTDTAKTLTLALCPQRIIDGRRKNRNKQRKKRWEKERKIVRMGEYYTT
jgi:hypothetical protein